MKALVDFARQVLTEQGRPKPRPSPHPDTAGEIVAVKIGGSVIGDFWLVLSDDEPFDPGDGLPVYRPSEIRALKAKGYGPEALLALHRAKVILNGKIARE